MRTLLRICCVAALLTSLAPFSSAQPATGSSAPLYDIELIVFERNVQGAGSTERWPPITTPPDWSGAIALADHPSANGIRLLPEGQYRLSDAYRRLRATRGRLRPLLHIAWRQPVVSRGRSTPLYLDSEASRDGSQVEGTVLVSSKRYLHLDLDLLLTRPGPSPFVSDEQNGQDALGDNGLDVHRYRLQDHRRMRSREIHYIDHPLMGVLVLATPYSAPKPVTAEPEPAVEPTPETPSPKGTTEQRETPPSSGGTTSR